MKTLSATELDLLTFFECEPQLLDADIPWNYNDALYQFALNGLQLSFAIAPAYGDIRLILQNDTQILYELNAMSVIDVRYHNDKGIESLEIQLSHDSQLWISLKPAISLRQTQNIKG